MSHEKTREGPRDRLGMRGMVGSHDSTLKKPERVVRLAAKSLAEMTDKQLESEWTKAAKDLEKLKKQLREFSQEHQRRAAQARAEQVLETMSDDEKRALLQTMETQGIESKESVQGVRS